MLNKETLEIILGGAFLGISLATLSGNLISYYAISSLLCRGSLEDADLQKDIAKYELEEMNKKGRLYRLFLFGPRLAYKNFLRKKS